MRILFYTNSLTAGGKERRLVELLKGLAKDPTIEMELVLLKKDLHYLDSVPAKVKISYTLRKNLKKDPRTFYQFYKIARKFKPDIINVWGNMSAFYAIPTKLFLRIPMINNQIADATLKFSSSIIDHRFTFPFSNMILANSHAGLEAYSAPKNKSDVIYNGFDFKRLQNLEERNVVREKFNITTTYVVGMVARFSEMKDYKSYIEAANTVLSKNKDITFLCIGSGDDSESKKLVSSENINNILFLGRQNNVENIMNICDIGVLATYTEGISNALLEFSALEKPVVTNFGGGNAELVQQGITGYLVEQESPNQLAEKIEFLINNNDIMLKFGQEGKKWITEVFSIDKMITTFKEYYKKVIVEK